MIDVCPLCMNGKVESIPLPDKEIYTFDYDPTRGVTLDAQERERNLIPDSNLASDLISMNTLFGAIVGKGQDALRAWCWLTCCYWLSIEICV